MGHRSPPDIIQLVAQRLGILHQIFLVDTSAGFFVWGTLYGFLCKMGLAIQKEGGLRGRNATFVLAVENLVQNRSVDL